jgi:hypothetical protein
MDQQCGWLGEYEIIILHKNGTKEKQKVKNRITNAGLNMIRDAMLGNVSDLKLKYIAFGDSAIAIDDTQTQLGNERFRTSWVDQKVTGVGQIQSNAILLDNEAVFHIQEIGIFAGATASTTANTGIMISRILWSRNKTSLESIQFTRTDSINRG